MKIQIIQGDALAVIAQLPTESVQCCVTSPPYWGLRDYGCDGQLGLERTPEEYVSRMVEVFREVRRCLRKDGTLWLNIGDSYAAQGGDHSVYNSNQPNTGACRCHANGSGDKGTRSPAPGLKPKDLVGIPWRLAFALQADGWWLRSDIIWEKPNPMPESVLDRPTRAHEFIFLLTKSPRYYYDADAVREPYAAGSAERYEYAMQGTSPQCNQINGDVSRREREKAIRPPNPLGRNRRDVWCIPSETFSEAHFATFPPDLIKPCILAGSKPGDTILDPFGGSGTTGMVALELGRQALLIELNPEYVKLAESRCFVTPGLALA